MSTQKIRTTLTAIALVMVAGVLQPALASGLRASVNSTHIGFGDSFQLILSMDANSMTTAPDLTPLQQDFQILSTGRSSQTNIINGKRTDTTSWVITLTPNKKGKLTIPAITAGANSSQAMTVEVVEAQASLTTSSGAGEISIDVTVEPGTHYVQEEVPVRVRIQSGTAIRQAQLQEPSGRDFVLTQSGEDQVSHATRNGRDVTVIERRYFLKPQKSGELTIPPLVLQATLEDSSGRSSIFSNMGFPDMGFPGSMMRTPFNSSLLDDMFNPGRRVARRSEPLTLDVKARPTGDSVWFLPAKRVELQADWVNTNPVFRVGEGVTRKIRLFALGASREQLPDISLGESDGAQLYLDRSRDDSADTPEGTAAIREFDVSVVPTRAGQVTLPAIEVRWWDTTADVERVAALAAQTISVAAGTSSNTGNAHASTTPAASTRPGEARVANNTGIVTTQSATTIALLCLLMLTLVAGALLIARRRRSRGSTVSAARANEPKRSADQGRRRIALDERERSFVRACKANDLRAAYAALRGWMLTDSTSGRGMSPELASEMAIMEEHLYADTGNTTWSGKRAFTLFIKEKRGRRTSACNAASRSTLPALYPA